jgi:REP element-mobilizing transposase RayT
MGSFAKRFQDLGLLFITNSVLNQTYVFHRRKYAEIVMSSLRYCVEHQWFELHAYVLMPNHIHVILRAKENHTVEQILRDFKKFTAQQVLLTMRETDTEMLSRFWVGTRKQKYEFWEDNADIKNIVSAAFLIQKAEYMHRNPLRAAWADSLGITEPQDYEYSSARFYLEGVEDKYVKLSDFRELL